jgi:hypothetical protein
MLNPSAAKMRNYINTKETLDYVTIRETDF